MLQQDQGDLDLDLDPVDLPLSASHNLGMGHLQYWLWFSLLVASPIAVSAWDLGRHSCIFEKKVLQVGASVSAGYAGKSPGTLLMEAAKNKQSNPVDFVSPAVKGNTSAQQYSELKALGPAPTSPIKTVFALDLFYWDARENKDCDSAVRRATELLKKCKELGVNLVVGNVPDVKTNKECTKRINTELVE